VGYPTYELVKSHLCFTQIPPMNWLNPICVDFQNLALV